MTKRKTKSKKKDPSDYPMFSMRMSNEEKKFYSKIAKEYNKSLAELIREGLKVIAQNPAFLNPTENPYLISIQTSKQEDYQERIDYNQRLENKIEDLQKGFLNISRVLEKYVLKGKALNLEELQEAKHKDLTSEAVFEE